MTNLTNLTNTSSTNRNSVKAKSSEVQFIRVLEPQTGQRLDNFLIRHLKGLPRTRIYRLIRRGEVRVNKKRCKPDTKLATGDEVRIPPYRGPEERAAEKISPGLKKLLEDSVLYENEQVLVLNKPPGMAVHGGSGVRLGVIEAIRQIKPEWELAELAHRLDRDTTGCLIIAKKTPFLKHIQAAFKAKTVQKHYLALVAGQWPDDTEAVNAPLLKKEIGSGEKVVKVSEEGKPSLTRFRVLERLEESSLVEAMPETGRTHQIRVHCQYAGHPIMGDPKYSRRSTKSVQAKVKNLCLHAWKIQFTMPDSEQPIVIEAPMQKYLAGLLKTK